MKAKFLSFLDTLQKRFYLYFLIAFVCTTVIIAFKHYDVFFVYPEQEYQAFEREISRIVSSNDFNTDYQLDINYNKKRDYLEVQIGENDIFVTAKINNYNESEQQVTVQRNHNTTWHSIILLPVISLLITTLIFIIILILLFIIAVMLDITTIFKRALSKKR